MLTMNLLPQRLTRERAEDAVRRAIPELATVELSTCEDGDDSWWWGTVDYKHDWSGYVDARGVVQGPY